MHKLHKIVIIVSYKVYYSREYRVEIRLITIKNISIFSLTKQRKIYIRVKIFEYLFAKIYVKHVIHMIIKKSSSLICKRISDICLIFLFEKGSRFACKSDRKRKGGLKIWKIHVVDQGETHRLYIKFIFLWITSCLYGSSNDIYIYI